MIGANPPRCRGKEGRCYRPAHWFYEREGQHVPLCGDCTSRGGRIGLIDTIGHADPAKFPPPIEVPAPAESEVDVARLNAEWDTFDELYGRPPRLEGPTLREQLGDVAVDFAVAILKLGIRAAGSALTTLETALKEVTK